MDVYKQLRKKFDGADSFVDGGHTVGGKPSTSHTERVAKTPEWANDDEQVRLLLLKVFPKLETDEKQRARAAKWAQFIHLYFRMGWTASRIALELRVTTKYVEDTVYHIRRAVNGKRADTGEQRGIRPRGRPRKNNATLPAPSGSQGDDGHISL